MNRQFARTEIEIAEWRALARTADRMEFLYRKLEAMAGGSSISRLDARVRCVVKRKMRRLDVGLSPKTDDLTLIKMAVTSLMDCGRLVACGCGSEFFAVGLGAEFLAALGKCPRCYESSAQNLEVSS